MNKILLCLLILIVTGSNLYGVEPENEPIDYFSSANLLKFADYLFATGDYLRAAGEYQRYLFSVEDKTATDSVYYRMIKAFFRGGEFNRCLTLLRNFRQQYPDSKFNPDLPIYEAVVLMAQKKYGKAREKAAEGVGGNLKLRTEILAAGYLYTRDYLSSRQYACELDNDSGLCDKLKSADTLSFKSKFLAGAFSTLVPGLGKIYSGRTADGIYAALLVGLSAWQAYDGFDDDGSESVKGWIFAGVGTVFYLGNIYGSTVAAEIYNCKVHNEYVKGLQISITLP